MVSQGNSLGFKFRVSQETLQKEIFMNPNNTEYIANNWLKESATNSIQLIEAKGGAIALMQSGEILYRLSRAAPFIKSKNHKMVGVALSSFVGKEVLILSTSKKPLDNEECITITPQDLKLVVDEIFDPFIKKEFIEQEDGLYKINRFKPSDYMELKPRYNPSEDIQKGAIIALILHLAQYNEEYAEWIINWLAYFFQGLKKSQVALVLQGVQGAGKGIFFTKIITALISEQFVKTINDKSLNSPYLGSLVEDVLFFNLDEISVKNSKGASTKNFLKALVTNDTITAENKFETLKEERKIYGQILITSNELEALEIEPSDRRFSVLETGPSLLQTNFLGYGSSESFLNAIEDELELFALYLKSYRVDIQKANSALSTPQKDALIHLYLQKQQKHRNAHLPKLSKLQKNIQEFAFAIRTKNINYFESIRLDKPELYHEIYRDIYNGYFKIVNLLSAFILIYGNRSVKTNSELLMELQNHDFHQFNRANFHLLLVDGIEENYLAIVPLHPNHNL